MNARILDGRSLGRTIRTQIRADVEELTRNAAVVPGLAVILIGEDAASRVYVTNKIKACADVGIRSTLIEYPNDVPAEALIDAIKHLNQDPAMHGILVQLPLPPHHDVRAVLHAISIEKDVDGFHLYNVGGLVVGDMIFSPCTPFGVMKILDHAGIPVEGKNVTIVGASNIVGKPMALMMMQRDATVAVCHEKTRDLAQYTILADILIVAAGVPNLILPQMVRTGAVVIDVGINRLPDGRLVGDVDFDGVCRRASCITPVPGGVGPMTVTMLLANTVSAARRFVDRTRGPILEPKRLEGAAPLT
ncbi:bifunctional methylenetetrahydrofolate dehydrogenase/methenyltetrahydrofolate cyclohydrolase FolD [Bradyrhizobium sp. ma5]|uniref:bifunctional methylenetetrahydrofolate dehydrogenase/methenyltetrahydrofolate cyclohydrolase FolD n=1 Tax=Bradyrhizobium sp. ma5 TaxID=3344828 RepID=UPI0035D3F0B5